MNNNDTKTKRADVMIDMNQDRELTASEMQAINGGLLGSAQEEYSGYIVGNEILEAQIKTGPIF